MKTISCWILRIIPFSFLHGLSENEKDTEKRPTGPSMSSQGHHLLPVLSDGQQRILTIEDNREIPAKSRLEFCGDAPAEGLEPLSSARVHWEVDPAHMPVEPKKGG
jgi:hypothetical protein